jgi:type I restriction enzyme R subunit
MRWLVKAARQDHAEAQYLLGLCYSCGWGVVEDSHISVEYPITNGRVSKSVAPKPLKADYVLWYKGVKLAVVEAKSDEKDVSEGVAQAKLYAEMLDVRFTYATNGD